MSLKLQDDLAYKIRQKRGAHGVLEEKFKKITSIYDIVNIVATALISLLAFSSLSTLSSIFPSITKETLSILIGSLSFFLFVINVIFRIKGYDLKSTQHREAVQVYSQILRDIGAYKEQAPKNIIDKAAIESFNMRYIQSTFSVIKITNKEFENAERKFIKHMAMRRAKINNPFMFPWQIRKVAKEKVSDVREWMKKL